MRRNGDDGGNMMGLRRCPACDHLVNGEVNGRRCPHCQEVTFPQADGERRAEAAATAGDYSEGDTVESPTENS